jgi:hypothetical protein
LTQEGVAEENESGWFEFVREVRQLGSSEKKDVLTHDG